MSAEERPGIEALKAMCVRAFADRDALREVSDAEDMGRVRLREAVHVLNLALDLYDQEARRLFQELPIACEIRVSFNKRGKERNDARFGDHRRTFHIVPVKRLTGGGLDRPPGQPLCRVLAVKPHGLQLSDDPHRPNCHGCLVRAEKLIQAAASAL